MHGLEVCRGHVRLSLRRFQVRIAHHFLQQKDVSTPAQIARCERVPCGVERAPWCGESQRKAKALHVPQHVAPVERRLRRCRKQGRVGRPVEARSVAA